MYTRRIWSGALLTAVGGAAVLGTFFAVTGRANEGAPADGGGLAAPARIELAQASDADDIARGRYFVVAGSCNDCHTAGWPESAGTVPESEWLTGVPIGFQGPWGTSYPTNLRLVAQTLSEDQWVARSRAPLLPPMPWFSLRDMREDDVRAIYRYIRSLGPAGEPAPTFVPPGGVVSTPVYDFVPRMVEAATP